MQDFLAQNAGRGSLTVKLNITEATLIAALGQPIRIGDAAYNDDDGKVPMYWEIPCKSSTPTQLPRIWSWKGSHVSASFSTDLQGADIARFEHFITEVQEAQLRPPILYYWKGGTEVGSWIATLAGASPTERRKIERMGYVTRISRIAPSTPPTEGELNGVLALGR